MEAHGHEEIEGNDGGGTENDEESSQGSGGSY